MGSKRAVGKEPSTHPQGQGPRWRLALPKLEEIAFLLEQPEKSLRPGLRARQRVQSKAEVSAHAQQICHDSLEGARPLGGNQDSEWQLAM